VLSAIVTGYRSNSFKILITFLIACIGLAWLSSSFSARNPQVLMLDVGLSLQSIILTLMAIFWVQELYYKDLERKVVISLLAYPVSRAEYLVSRFCAVFVLVALAVLCSGLMLLIAVTFSGIEYIPEWPAHMGLPYVMTWFYIWLDILVVVAFTFMLCSLSETANLPVLCSIGFSIAMHYLGPVVDYLSFANNVDPEHQKWILPAIEKLLYVLPDLDRLDIRQWVLYGDMPPVTLLAWAGITAVTYVILFLLASIIVLYRREIV
jgi:ABC-type transport system involved in multi-copper enzyme maturation permease subunit